MAKWLNSGNPYPVLFVWALGFVAISGVVGYSEKPAVIGDRALKDAVDSLNNAVERLNSEQALGVQAANQRLDDARARLEGVRTDIDNATTAPPAPNARNANAKARDAVQHLISELTHLRDTIAASAVARATQLLAIRTHTTALVRQIPVDLAPVPKTSGSVVATSVGTGMVRLLSSWPAMTFFIIAFALSSGAIEQLGILLRGVKSLKLFGAAEIQLTEDNARLVGTNINELFDKYRSRIADECVRLVRGAKIREKMERVFSDGVRPLLGPHAAGVRCTIHVPDILFTESLYQLVDYYPKGAGAARAWSDRFGLIGVVWRLGVSKVRCRVPTDPNELIEKWAMSPEQAATAGSGRQSFAGVLLTKAGIGSAILYLDHKDTDVFGVEAGDPLADGHPELVQRWTSLKSEVKRVSEECGLIDSLTEIQQKLQELGPYLNVSS